MKQKKRNSDEFQNKLLIHEVYSKDYSAKKKFPFYIALTSFSVNRGKREKGLDLDLASKSEVNAINVKRII